MEDPQHRIFLSYNSADREWVRKLAAALTLAGAQVWFDEWVIRPGDSIPTAIDEGLSNFGTFALVWSEAASQSRWVRTEMDAAIIRWAKGDGSRLVPIRRDNIPVPAILASIRYIDGSDGDHLAVARQLVGLPTEAAFRVALQKFIDEAQLDFRDFYGVGVLVACPRCGATPDKLEGWEATDDERDDRYAGARCTVCRWEDGSEI